MRLYIFLTFICFKQIISQTWQDVGGGHNNSSHGMCIYNGKLIDVGSFNNPCNRVAQWDGASWSCFNNGVGLVGRSAIEFNGDLIVVGDFWNVQQPCIGCNGIARWNGSNWQPLGSGFNNDVLCLGIWNGYLVAGGDFTVADGNQVSRIAYWDGTTWNRIGGINDFNNDVRAICVYDGDLWLGGDFSNVAGCTACDGLVKWDGTNWLGGDSGVDINGGVDSTVRCFYVDPLNNLLYMGGHFQGLTVNGTYNPNLNGVAVYDGTNWSSLGAGVNSYVRALGEYNGNIIVGGDFTNAGGISANKIAKWNPTNQNWSSMGMGMNDYVKSMAVYNGELYVGGPFTIADGLSRNCIAKWYESPSIPPVTSFSTSTYTICQGVPINFTDLSTNNPNSWSWTFLGSSLASSNSQNPSGIIFNLPGSYTVSLQSCNSSGCGVYTQTILVTSFSIDAGIDQTICSGNTTTLNATAAGVTYSWVPQNSLSCFTCNTTAASPSTSTQYTVYATNSLGCNASDSVKINVLNYPVAYAGADSTICLGNSLTLNSNGFGSFSWYPFTGLSCNNCPNPIASPTLNTAYILTITNGGICSSSDSVYISVQSCLTSDDEILNTERFLAYPNPTLGLVNLEIPIQFFSGNLKLFDSLGKLIFNFENINNEFFILPNLESGIYFVYIEKDLQIIKNKIIVLKTI